MITHSGARALGLSGRFGTVTDGANERLCALTIPPGTTDPLEVVLESGQIQSS